MATTKEKLGMSLEELLKQHTSTLGATGAPANQTAPAAEGRLHAGGGTTIVVAKRCYVGNLSFKTSWQDLKDHFRSVGTVVYTKVIQDEATGQSKGCGIVEFESPDQAAAAIETLNDVELNGRPLIVREDREDRDLKHALNAGGARQGEGVFPAAKRARLHEGPLAGSAAAFGQSRRVFVQNLSYRTSWQDLKDHFRQVGEVIYANVMEESPGRSKGCGIVEFKTAAEAAQAIKMLHDSYLGERLIGVREDREDREVGGGVKGSDALIARRIASNIVAERSGKGGKGGAQGGKGGAYGRSDSGWPPKAASSPIGVSKRCYVGNLSYRTSWQDLKDHFRSVGKVIFAKVMEESGTGRSKGCGIVEFETSAEAFRALSELHDTELNERLIFVREDREDRDLK